ncbi:hypothetical protein ACHAXS_001009, partial [Conticribra weissflogii]
DCNWDGEEEEDDDDDDDDGDDAVASSAIWVSSPPVSLFLAGTLSWFVTSGRWDRREMGNGKYGFFFVEDADADEGDDDVDVEVRVETELFPLLLLLVAWRWWLSLFLLFLLLDWRERRENFGFRIIVVVEGRYGNYDIFY